VEKVMVVGYAAADTPAIAVADITALNERLLAGLDERTFPGLSLQVEDHGNTERWQRRTRPPARRVAASLAVWAEDGDDVGTVTAIFGEVWPDHSAGVVTETVTRWRTERATSATEPQPGVTVTSMLHRRPDMTFDAFVAHWRDVHQPMSLRIHPQRTYVRNLVTRAPEPAPPRFDAICEEGFASIDDVLEPARFFGADPTAPWKDNARTIGEDVPLFLDTEHTVATIMREYRLREFRP
jgi:hypothetical protein